MERNQMIRLTDDMLLIEFVGSGHFPGGANRGSVIAKHFNEWLVSHDLEERKVSPMGFACTLKRCKVLNVWKTGHKPVMACMPRGFTPLPPDEL